MDQNHFFQIISRRQNLEHLKEIVVSQGEDQSYSREARSATLNLLTRFAKQFSEQSKKSWRDDEDSDEKFGGVDNSDDVLMDNSDDEEEKAAKKRSSEQNMIDIYTSLIKPAKQIIEQEAPKEEIKSTFNERSSRPLGLLRLRAVELLQQIASLKKTSLAKSLLSSGVSENLVNLIKTYPWNNFLQIRVQMYFDELLDNDELTSEEKLTLLKQAGLTQSLVTMSKDASVEFASGFAVRNGYMGFVTKISNLVSKLADNGLKNQDTAAEVFNEDWNSFVSEELASSNERDNRELGGRTGDADEDDGQFDVNMDRIMQRFKVFAGSQQSSSEEDDRDEDEDEDKDEDEEDQDEEEEEQEDKPASNEEVEEKTSEKDHTTFKEVTIKVELPKEEQVDASFADSGYWKVSGCAENLEDLLADYE